MSNNNIQIIKLSQQQSPFFVQNVRIKDTSIKKHERFRRCHTDRKRREEKSRKMREREICETKRGKRGKRQQKKTKSRERERERERERKRVTESE